MYWKDIFNNSEEWIGLKIEIKEDIPTTFLIESGANCRFKLYNQNTPILWGTFGVAYWGVWVLTHKIAWEVDEMPIPPIGSKIIEQSKNEDYYKFWSRFFSSALNKVNKKQQRFFSQGLWTITIGKSTENKIYNKSEAIIHITDAFVDENPRFTEWDIGRYGRLITLKEASKEEEGRVKWFRKLVKENTCPPVLLWFVSCLDGYVVLDGHVRLKAFELEAVPLRIVVLNAIKEQEIKRDSKKQNSLLKGLEKSNLETNKINEYLIPAFDTRPYIYPITKAKARNNFNTTWITEVKEMQRKLNLNAAQVEDMINRIEI